MRGEKMIGSRTHGVQEDQVVQPEAAGIGPVRNTYRKFLQLFASILYSVLSVVLPFASPLLPPSGWESGILRGQGDWHWRFFDANAKPLRYLGTYHRPNPIPLLRTSYFC